MLLSVPSQIENLWKCTSERLAEQGFVSTLLNRDPDYRSINDTGYLFSVPWNFLPSSPFFTASAMAIYPRYIHVDLFHSAPSPLPWVWQAIQGMFWFCDKHSFSWYGIFNYLNKKVYIAPSNSKSVLYLRHTADSKIQHYDPSQIQLHTATWIGANKTQASASLEVK